MKEEKVARPDVLSYEQGRQDERAEIQAGAVSVAGLIEKARQEIAREIFEVYDRYVKLLGEEIDVLSPLAISHGWRSLRFEAGEKCRADIKALKNRFLKEKK